MRDSSASPDCSALGTQMGGPDNAAQLGAGDGGNQSATQEELGLCPAHVAGICATIPRPLHSQSFHAFDELIRRRCAAEAAVVMQPRLAPI
jgi:hypothetical protein